MHIGTDDHQLHVSRWDGNGPPALLIHGIGSSGTGWNDLSPLLADFLEPYAIDLRGHGQSAHPDSGYLYDNYIDDLDRLLPALEISNPILIGHSLGGIVALWWAARHSHQAAAVVAIDSPLRSGEEFRPAFDAWIAQNAMPVDDLAAHYLQNNPEWTADRARRRAEIMTSTAPGVFWELKDDSMHHHGVDRIAELEQIEAPVLLIRGDPRCGSLVHPADADALVTRLPNAEVMVIPDGTHSLHRQFPQEVVDAIRSFLARHRVITGEAHLL